MSQYCMARSCVSRPASFLQFPLPTSVQYDTSCILKRMSQPPTNSPPYTWDGRLLAAPQQTVPQQAKQTAKRILHGSANQQGRRTVQCDTEVYCAIAGVLGAGEH